MVLPSAQHSAPSALQVAFGLVGTHAGQMRHAQPVDGHEHQVRQVIQRDLRWRTCGVVQHPQRHPMAPCHRGGTLVSRMRQRGGDHGAAGPGSPLIHRQ